jgi:DNA-binding ferritin-like protein (Dps family)
MKQLPAKYRTAVDAIERYLNYCGGLVDTASAESLLEDIADLFERAAADGTPIREIVGDDPVEFVEALVRNYEQGGYVARERARPINAIKRAAGKSTESEEETV